jgi:hypothetical protein
MIARRCVPLPMSPASSRHDTANSSERPSTAISSSVAVTVIPTGVATTWLTSICVPTVCWPADR